MKEMIAELVADLARFEFVAPVYSMKLYDTGEEDVDALLVRGGLLVPESVNLPPEGHDDYSGLKAIDKSATFEGAVSNTNGPAGQLDSRRFSNDKVHDLLRRVKARCSELNHQRLSQS